MYRKKEETQTSTAPSPFQTIEEAVEHAKRAFALKKYEQSVDHYATALELAYVALTCYFIRSSLIRACRTGKYGEDAPETADLYFSYGKALLENAISQASVLGKQGEEEKVNTEGMSTVFDNPERFAHSCMPSGSSAGGSGPILSFSGDAEDIEDSVEVGEDVAVDLFADAAKKLAADDNEAEGEGDDDADDAEPEDDFNAAWEVLDLARAIYDKQMEDNEEVKLKLADTYITLGDISLETG